MKEVGHVQNWATTIEADMRTISTALEYAYKGKLPVAHLLKHLSVNEIHATI